MPNVIWSTTGQEPSLSSHDTREHFFCTYLYFLHCRVNPLITDSTDLWSGEVILSKNKIQDSPIDFVGAQHKQVSLHQLTLRSAELSAIINLICRQVLWDSNGMGIFHTGWVELPALFSFYAFQFRSILRNWVQINTPRRQCQSETETPANDFHKIRVSVQFGDPSASKFNRINWSRVNFESAICNRKQEDWI